MAIGLTGRVSRNRWRSVAAQLAALALLLRAVLFPVCGLEGPSTPAGEPQTAAVLALAELGDEHALCLHGSDADTGSPSNQSGDGKYHKACCASCCTPSLPAALAAVHLPHADPQLFDVSGPQILAPAALAATRNRGPPAFLSA